MDADVCVIGSGAGGSTLAAELALRGCKVVLLELGRKLDPRVDFAAGPKDKEGLPKALSESEAWAPVVPGKPVALQPGYDELRSFNRFAPVPPLTARPPAQVVRALGLGGSTLRFQGCSDRWAAELFKNTALEDVDLLPYYAAAEARLRVHGPRAYHRYKPIELGPASRRMEGPFRQAGLELLPSALAIHASQGLDPGRGGCTRVNLCTSGCPNAAKSSYDLGMLARAQSACPERLEIRTHALATRLVVNRSSPGIVEAVEYADLANGRPPDGERARIRATTYVLCAGPLETPRLLMFSASSRHPLGIGNAHGRVGVGLIESLYVGLVLLFDEPLLSFRGPSMESMAETVRECRPIQVTVTQEALNLERPLEYARRLTSRAYGAERMKEVAARFGKAVGVLLETGQQARNENRVLLDGSQKDPLGRPAVRIESSLGAWDLESLRLMLSMGRSIARAAGVDVAELQTSYDSAPGGAELRGSCRMDDDPARGVVDGKLRIHGMENVYVADASVLPISGPGNPSLTVAALATRLAELLSTAPRK